MGWIIAVIVLAILLLIALAWGLWQANHHRAGKLLDEKFTAFEKTQSAKWELAIFRALGYKPAGPTVGISPNSGVTITGDTTSAKASV